MTRKRPLPHAAVGVIVGVLVLALGIVTLYRFLAAPSQPIPTDTPQVKVPAAPVAEAANELLSVLDAGDYDAAFDRMASRFREGTERTHFVPALRATRAPLGHVRERTLKSESAAERDPQGRLGPFRMNQYLTTFDAGPRLEVLVMVAEGDSWRLYSYNVATTP